MTNSFFVIIVTLIITFYIWIVKNCHQAPCRYSFFRISPCTVAVLLKYSYSHKSITPQIPPLFSAKNIPQYRSQYLPSCQHLPTCQHLPGCESFNKLQAPTSTRHDQDTHTTRAGKDSQYKDYYYYNSLYYKIIYIFIDYSLLSSWPFLITKRKCLFV